MITEGKWIHFALIDERPKTSVWEVEAKEGHTCLGLIQWFGRWRGYAFFPDSCCVFEQRCLRDIAYFIEHQNAAHKAKNKAAKEQKP